MDSATLQRLLAFAKFVALLPAAVMMQPVEAFSRSGIANVIVEESAPQNRQTGDFRSFDAHRVHGGSASQAAGPDARFTFVSKIPVAGYYRLLAWWPDSGGAGGMVVYRIRAGRQSHVVRVNQGRNGGRWVALGDFLFVADRRIEIELVGLNGGRVVADAVRLEHMGMDRPGLAVGTSALPVATVGETFHAWLSADGGRPPYRWQDQGTLPLDLRLDPRTGEIAGTARFPGDYTVVFLVTDANGETAVREVPFVVLPDRASFPRDRGDRAALSPGVATEISDLAALPWSPPGSAAQTPDLSDLIMALAATPEGGWLKANTNLFSDVWTPEELRPLLGLSNPNPWKIIQAWSSFAWDSNRGDLIIYGGGHANYSGNDVYRWRGTTRQWERASLPSEVISDDLDNFIAIDGPDAAPTSAHTYDNSVFLPIADRYLTFGGAVHGAGGAYKKQVDPVTERKTGPYFFDPSRADGDKVGGSTGSHVQREAPFLEIVGGNMWENRDIPGIPELADVEFPRDFIDGATAHAQENGVDVVYVSGRPGGTAQHLYKYTIPDINDRSQDTWEKVGRMFDSFNGQGSGAFSAASNVFVRTSQDEFIYWDLTQAAPGNRNVIFVPEDENGPFSANRLGALDYDPTRDQFAIWNGGGEVWMLKAPPVISAFGWTVTQQPAPLTETPVGDTGTGILGKWNYIPNLDAFMGIEDNRDGNIWIYKPVGWQNPLE